MNVDSTAEVKPLVRRRWGSPTRWPNRRGKCVSASEPVEASLQRVSLCLLRLLGWARPGRIGRSSWRIWRHSYSRAFSAPPFVAARKSRDASLSGSSPAQQEKKSSPGGWVGGGCSVVWRWPPAGYQAVYRAYFFATSSANAAIRVRTASGAMTSACAPQPRTQRTSSSTSATR